MSSTLIPSQDLVPSVSSRVVTIDATSMLEATPDGEHWVDFILPQDLHVAADDKIIMAGSERVTLSAGKGTIRLPTYDPDAKTVDGSSDWVVLVKKSWTGQGCGHGRGCGCGGAYAIRVPVGTSSISLADLPAVRPLTPREQMYAITGASVSVSVGSPGGSVTLDGGILRFDLSIPEASFTRGILENGTDTRVMRGAEWRGQWTIPSATAWNSMLGLPEMSRGWNAQLTAVNGPPGYASRNAHDLIVLSDPPARFYRVEHTTNVWSDWVEISQYPTVRGALLDGASLNTLRGMESVGLWYVPPSATVAGYPLEAGGIVDVKSGPTGYAYTVQVLETFGGLVRTLKRSMTSATDWSAWTEIGTGGGGGPSPADPWEPLAVGASNADLLSEMEQRKGGAIGTDGRIGFALRVDHGTVAFRDHLAPIVNALGLPLTMAVYSEQREIAPDTNGVPWDEVASWHHEYGMTFGNHSDDHLDKPGPDGWYGGTIGSLAELKAHMPSVPVEQYIPHGSTGYDRYGGFNRAATHEDLVGTLAGRMALSSHALISGYRHGTFRPLTGSPAQGLTHWSMENSTVAEFKSMLDRAIEARRGFAVMFHPEFIGAAGKMTWAQVEECLTYVAQKRDEGVLLPLTLDGLAFAKIDSAHRDDLAPDPTLQTPVGGTASSSPGAVTVAAGQYARASVGLGYTTVRGSARSVEWVVNASAPATVRVRASANSASPGWVAERTITLAPGEATVHAPFGIPLDASGFWMELHCDSGSVTATELHCYAI